MNSIELDKIGQVIILYEGQTCTIYVPSKPHISPKDGGHLMVIPNRIVDERSKLMPVELLEIGFLSIAAGKTLISLNNADWINYQENGNWSLDSTKERRLHLHVYGRKKSAKSQPFGESLLFPLKKDLAKWYVEPYNDGEIKLAQDMLINFIEEEWAKPYLKIINSINGVI